MGRWMIWKTRKGNKSRTNGDRGIQMKIGTITGKRNQQDKMNELEKEAEKREELVAEEEMQGVLGQKEEVDVEQDKEQEKE